jgi:hypothetical protein
MARRTWSLGSGRAETAMLGALDRIARASAAILRQGQEWSLYFPRNAVHGAANGRSSAEGAKRSRSGRDASFATTCTRYFSDADRRKGMARAMSPSPHNSVTSIVGSESWDGFAKFAKIVFESSA